MKPFSIACCGLLLTALLPLRAAGEERADPKALERGRILALQCTACHALGDDGIERVGPHLKNLEGRKAGAVEDYPYSAALAESDLVWDAETLEAFLADPLGLVPGNKMAYEAMDSAQDRRDLTAYLLEATRTE